MSIRVLSDQTINQIAAGEVIENPASAIKELIENALDAGAKNITVEIERGGFSLIRISDDGCGMSQDDLLLSIERHATSKIQKADDLNEVLTMGFRGEALASIAAISKMKITTAIKGNPLGSELVSDGGKIRSIEGAARRPGTTIEIRALFFNVPARKKFQKSQRAAQNENVKRLYIFALAHPKVRIRLIVDGKEVRDVLPGSLKERCDAVLGEGFLSGASPIDYADNGCEIEGFIGSPLGARTNRLGQYLFVNGRAVFCPQISYAVYEGFGTRIDTRLHPTFVLHLTLPTAWVDVNVHPQKREIRLREGKVIQDALRKGVMSSFKGSAPTPPLKREWNFEETPLQFQETPKVEPPTFDLQLPAEELSVLGLFDFFLIVHPTPLLEPPYENAPFDGLFLVDLEGGAARLLYEHFLKEKNPPLQTLMIPLTLEFVPQEGEVLAAHLDEIKKMGIDLRPFGEGSFIVDALNPEIGEGEVEGLLQKFLEVFDQNLAQKEREKKLAFTLSSYARSRKKGWTILEAKRLVLELLKTEAPYHCPKGKKTVVHLSHEKLSSLFQKTTATVS
ncbi:DNA mismatch repair endonuclease MutL [Candidatus Neptunochlamydia vexilliferae]|uniref:DNA mismatch repair endonuclease MutL n=1 Tax=Candidatus Neptunichlamydia vexilliferae TaxID=1651774 RepID=UPI001890CC17|nr:DNA mismatch repair endonuclease MutL [Candidatus Neptunochlamydia vexilliferae]